MSPSNFINASSGDADVEPSLQRNSPGDGPSDEGSLDRVVRLIKRRGWMILIAGAIGLAAAVTANLVMTKKYTAGSGIEVRQDISGEFRLEQIAGAAAGGDVDSGKINTEIEIIRSKTLALDTIRSLHLENDPDFLKPIAGRPWDLSRPGDRSALIGSFLRNLKVARLGQTNIVQIFVTSRRPELSALIANTLIDNYVEHTFKDSFTSTQKISTWLNKQLGGLKDNLQDSQQRMVDLEKDVGIIGIDQQEESVAVTHLEELNKLLVDAEADRMLKESAFRVIQSSTPGVVDALSPQAVVLQTSKENLALLKSQYQGLIQTYGSSYPRVKELKAQIDLVQQGVSAEEQAQISGAEKALDSAKGHEGELRRTVDEEKQDVYKNGSKVIQFELARTEYKANRELYDGIQERLQEAGILAGLHSTSVHIVEEADIPTFPSQPRVTLNLAGGLGAGFFLGAILALLLEAMDTNLRTMAEVEEALGLPLLAAIPEVDPGDMLPANFNQHAMSGQAGSWSRIGEALRGLRTSVLLSTAGAPPQIIMISSTRPGEGKTSIAILESIIFVLNGARVLLIDADLRRPAIHLRIKSQEISSYASKNVGLSSVLSGKATLNEAIQPWPDQPGLHLLLSGPLPPLPSELLGSKQMADLLAQLRTQYDFIIIDTPPVLTVTDASVLGRLADAAVLVVRYGEAQRHVITRSIELLQRSGANLLGVALNMVDFGSPEYSEYYGRKYYDYYGPRETEKAGKDASSKES